MSWRWSARPARRPTSKAAHRPRAAAMLAGAARARAALDGRDYVIPDDVKALAPAVLRHRVHALRRRRDRGPAGRRRDRPPDRRDRGAALIYPTRRMILIAAAAAPAALAVGARRAGLLVGGARPARPPRRSWRWSTRSPAPRRRTPRPAARARSRSASARASRCAVGARFPRRAPAPARIRARRRRPARRARRPARARPASDGGAAFALRAERRGTARIESLWLRWPGPLGLVWKQRWLALDRDLLITPDIRAVRDMSVQMQNRDAMLRRQGAAPGRRGRRVRGAGLLSPGHGPPGDRLEAIGPPQRPDRQGISHRAQQQYRHGARCRPGDVGAARRRAARRPRGLGRLAHRLCRAQGRRPGRPVRVRFAPARGEPADRRPARLRDPSAHRRLDRLFDERDQLHARHRDFGGGPQPALADHRLHRIRRHDQRRADAGRGRHPAEAPPRPVRRRQGRGAGGARRGRAGDAPRTSAARSPPPACCASGGSC